MNVGDTDSTVEAKPDERIHPWTRYVALGDSFTEGIGDPEPDNRPGWSSTHSMCRTTSSRCSLSGSASAVGAKPARATSYGHASIFVPWVIRRIRHRSSGDGILPKRPTPGPVFGPADTFLPRS